MTVYSSTSAGLGPILETPRSRRSACARGEVKGKRRRGLQADLFGVKIFQKLAIFELVDETWLGDIGRLERFWRLFHSGADIHQRLQRFAVKFRQRAQLRGKIVVHGIYRETLVVGK